MKEYFCFRSFKFMFLYMFLRFFEREVNFGLKLLVTVRTDLEDVVAITSSGKLFSSFTKKFDLIYLDERFPTVL